MIVSSFWIAFKKLAHCNNGKSQCALQSPSERSNPKTLKLKALGCFIFTHPIFLANNPGFLFHQMRFSDKEPHVFFNSKYFQFSFKEPRFFNSKEFDFFFKEPCLFSKGGLEAEVGGKFSDFVNF